MAFACDKQTHQKPPFIATAQKYDNSSECGAKPLFGGTKNGISPFPFGESRSACQNPEVPGQIGTIGIFAIDVHKISRTL